MPITTKNGAAVLLGQILGRGGEGEVYEVQGQPNVVAKLYFTPPDRDKQQQLTLMAEATTDKLVNHAAWPQQTLHQGVEIVGFLMPKLARFWPVHELYTPTSRIQHFPGQSWAMLLLAARNTAAAFTTLHDAGLVIGDVNERNVMVNHQAQIRLIDCDSFQISNKEHTFICKTGVDVYTPPELQHIKSFKEIKRTSNHDLFGLALLIFQLLFSGRNPYAGVAIPQRQLGDGLPWKIKNFCFAYASDALRRGLVPPPGTLPLSFVPQGLALMFERAFTETGINQRPRADEWLRSLDLLHKNLSRCAVSSVHVYPNHLGGCPWCDLEAKSGAVYFILHITSGSSTQPFNSSFDFQQIMARIKAIKLPDFVAISVPQTAQASPLPREALATRVHFSALKKYVYVVLAILFFASPNYWFIYIAVAIGSTIALNHYGDQGLNREKIVRRKRKEEAQKNYDDCLASWKQVTSHFNIAPVRAKLDEAVYQYQNLTTDELRQLEKLQQNIRHNQLIAHLQRCSLAYANIQMIGVSRKAELRSFGISTAADVVEHAILAVPGFGRKLTDILVQWRRECEQRFVFNPQIGVSDADRNAVHNTFLAKRKTLELELQNGIKKLEDQLKAVNHKLNVLRPILAKRAMELSEANADFTAILALK